MAEALRYPPLPPGTPHLMPFEAEPFNGDTHMEGEFLKLRDQFGIRTVIETGTCYGSSALWFADHFEKVLTAEINEVFASIAFGRLAELVDGSVRMNFVVRTGDSSVLMPEMISAAQGPTLFFLDAHWGKQCPLLDELKAIANAGIRPCIVIHDFEVPGTDFGFDAWNDQPFTLEWVTPYLDRIYGEGRWSHNYPTEVAGARRGWISIEAI